MRLKQRIKKSKLEIIAAITVLGATALTIGLCEGYKSLERKNIFQGTKNVIADVYSWLNECYQPGYVNDLERNK